MDRGWSSAKPDKTGRSLDCTCLYCGEGCRESQPANTIIPMTGPGEEYVKRQPKAAFATNGMVLLGQEGRRSQFDLGIREYDGGCAVSIFPTQALHNSVFHGKTRDNCENYYYCVW